MRMLRVIAVPEQRASVRHAPSAICVKAFRHGYFMRLWLWRVAELPFLQGLVDPPVRERVSSASHAGNSAAAVVPVGLKSKRKVLRRSSRGEVPARRVGEQPVAGTPARRPCLAPAQSSSGITTPGRTTSGRSGRDRRPPGQTLRGRFGGARGLRKTKPSQGQPISIVPHRLLKFKSASV